MLCIKNGVQISGAGQKKCDLWIDEGKIAAPPEDTSGAQIFDADGCYLFPGFIDAHTHLDMDAGLTHTADDFASGTTAALVGGTTTILDFATQYKGGTLKTALDTWHKLADGNSSCDYGFHMAVTDWNDNTKRELEDMVSAGVTSFKAYMAYDNLRITDDELRELLKQSAKLSCIVGAHCELGDIVNRNRLNLIEEGKTEPIYHAVSRPNYVEYNAIRRFLQLADEADAPAWVVHLSTGEGLEAVLSARENGQTVLVETCPQYITLSESVYITPNFEGAKYICSPPIRSSKDKLKLLEAARNGAVDIISTDHCSFNFKGQKELGRGDFTKIPNGLPGVEHRSALVWTAVSADPQRFCQLMTEEPAKAFGMYPQKGSLQVGADADVVVWDPRARWEIRADEQIQNVDYSPWEGFIASASARTVFLRGELCARNGKPIKTRHGQFVARKARWT